MPMGRIIYPLMGSAQRRLFDLRRVWGANVQERRFVELLGNHLDFDVLDVPEIARLGEFRSFYHDLFNQKDISVLIASPDVLSMRLYLKDTPAFVSTFHSVGHIEVIRQIITATLAFNPEFDRFVVGSEGADVAIRKIGQALRCNVLPTYGVYTPLFKKISMDAEEVREKYGIPLRDKILLFVGRVSREKNVHELIRMFKVIHTRVPDTSLLISGPIDPLMPSSMRRGWVAQLKGIVHKLNIADAVFFTFDTDDFIRPRDLSSIYNACDLFLYPTVYAQETRGIAPLEAMFCAKPVIATGWDGLRDTVTHGENGYLVDVYRTANYPVLNFYQFIQYTVHLLRHPDLLKAMGKNARKTAEQFTMDRVAQAFAEIVRECQDRYENRRTEIPYLHHQLSRTVAEVFSGKCSSPYIDLFDPTDSLEDVIRFGFLPQQLTYHHHNQTGTIIWQLINNFADRNIAEVNVRDHPSFVTTTELIIQPFSKIKGMHSPTVPSAPFWFVPLTVDDWERFFQCFREVDAVPIFTPETERDYKIADQLVSCGFLLPLADPPDLGS